MLILNSLMVLFTRSNYRLRVIYTLYSFGLKCSMQDIRSICCSITSRSKRFRFLLYASFHVLVTALCFGLLSSPKALVSNSINATSAAPQFYWHGLHGHTSEKQLCVSRSGGLTNEGIGAFFQHIKTSVILSNALNADLYIHDIDSSTHGYSLARLFRQSSCPNTNQTRLQCTVSNDRWLECLPSVCAGLLEPTSLSKLLGVEGCTTIYHSVETELNENLNDCAAPFYRKMMQVYMREVAMQYADSECIKIGVHIRWGDLASDSSKITSGTAFDERSISIDNINKAWSNLHFTNCECQEISLYIKNAVAIQNGTFLFEEYRIIDTGDDMLDLAHYTQNDILIQGVSSYPVLGLFSSTGKKIVITDHPKHRKFSQIFQQQHSVFAPSDMIFYDCKQKGLPPRFSIRSD
jgi:hypothetical protein